MEFDVVFLSRIQFAVAVFFHFIFVPLTLGLSVLVAIMETIYVKTNNELWKRMAKFWGKLFLINFALGVVTGITLEFQFGTNWSRYSAFVGDIFGSLLAFEATLAFALESTFIAVWHFGWDKVSKKVHALAIWLVAIATNLSAVFIILAAGFMHNPVGYEIVNGRAELADFFAVLTNPYAWGIFFHNMFAAFMLAGFFILGISSWHIARNSHLDFFKLSFKLAAPITLVMTLLVAVAGHAEGVKVAKYQPAKFAAMEAHWETSKNAPIYMITIPNEAEKENYIEALPLPGALSYLAFSDFNAEVKGLNDFPEEDIPPVFLTFLGFRTMIALGGLFIVLAFFACLKRNAIEGQKLLLKTLTWAIPLPYIAIAMGWLVTEVGRQPWIVYNLMRTSDAASPVPGSSVFISLIAFICVYSLLGVIDIYLLRKFAIKGPALPPAPATEKATEE